MSAPTTERQARVRRLEDDLTATPMRHYVYDDLPFAIVCYHPEDEWTMRNEMRLLRTRLENALARKVATISLAELDPGRHIAFITLAGALAPNICRVSKLLDEMKGRTRVPCVLFMPATTEGSSFRFTGIAENEGRGRYRTRVHA